ncbi:MULTISPECIES: hypothetical protein [unclassified Photobacterium]|uniref:hypothetical protein n=1 Tax=unclassified Photobacterium TaxID=2628852 RepID=UPI001EDE00D2|nr:MULTISPECIES: hypothetical protein [unclassified Photobacterium]MCG3866108.1 hypothetical protein [Photobacterium sp. Ph6]MCG3877599.1 hypothetical protein [Photobacterium sp. Ph5]
MSQVSETIDYIENLLSSIDKKVDASPEIQEIENIIKTKIPDNVRNLVQLVKLITDEVDIFCGYELENDQTLLQHYKDAFKKHTVSFFAGNFLDENFQAFEECGIKYYDEYSNSQHYSEDDEINDLRLILPLFMASGGYNIVLNLGGKQPGELLAVAQDYYFSVLAPSIEEHLSDLIGGLKSGAYQIGDEGYKQVVYPMSWGARSMVRSGEYFMDEDYEMVKK